jgi:MFS transporter, PAT family, beta-lactamase induction signal transducer AmpG
VDLRRKLSIIAWVYVIEGFPMGMYSGVFGVYFRRHHVDLAALGLLGGLGIAWSAKVLWSPLVDRFGGRLDWIRGALVAMSGALVVVSLAEPNPIGIGLWCALALYCAASATQDVAIDAYTIGIVDRGEEGPANSVRIAAYRLGFIAAGSGLLFLPRHIGWSASFGVAALASAGMALSLRAAPELPLPPGSERRPLRSLGPWLARPGVYAVAGFVLLYRIGDKAMGPMVSPFWVDRGFSDEQIAVFSTFVGAVATVAGAALGGGLVARLGIRASLWSTGALALLSNLGYAGAAWWPESGHLGVYGASLLESFTSGLVGAAFLSYLMRICEKEHAAVQYALLTAVYALAGSLLAGASGWFTQALGYAGYFALTAAFALPAFAFLPRAARWVD